MGSSSDLVTCWYVPPAEAFHPPADTTRASSTASTRLRMFGITTAPNVKTCGPPTSKALVT